MRITFDWMPRFLMLVAIAGLAGCAEKPAAESAGGAAADDHGHAHDHDHQGPHGGHVIELGADNFHAELTHDDATHTVGVYVLDGTAAATAPVAAEAVTINVAADGRPQQFTLGAKPLADDPAGKTSYFELVDETLCDGLAGDWDPHAATARLSITIDGTPYVGEIELGEHEHDEH